MRFLSVRKWLPTARYPSLVTQYLFRGFVFSVAVLATGQASPSRQATCGGFDKQIITTQRMPLFAICLTGVNGRETGTPKNVHAMWYGLKMRWINTAFFSAQMIEFHAQGDGANKFLVSEAVNIRLLGFSGDHLEYFGISSNSWFRWPNPTSWLTDESLDPVLESHAFNHAEKYSTRGRYTTPGVGAI